jgi:hypothetical protein
MIRIRSRSSRRTVPTPATPATVGARCAAASFTSPPSWFVSGLTVRRCVRAMCSPRAHAFSQSRPHGAHAVRALRERSADAVEMGICRWDHVCARRSHACVPGCPVYGHCRAVTGAAVVISARGSCVRSGWSISYPARSAGPWASKPTCCGNDRALCGTTWPRPAARPQQEGARSRPGPRRTCPERARALAIVMAEVRMVWVPGTDYPPVQQHVGYPVSVLADGTDTGATPPTGHTRHVPGPGIPRAPTGPARRPRSRVPADRTK